MGVPRKVFRIEETAADLFGQSEDAQAALRHAAVVQELAALRSMLAAAPPRPEGAGHAAPDAGATRLADELHRIAGAVSGNAGQVPRDSRAAAADAPTRLVRELGAAIESSEQAAQTILCAAEEIDHAAGTLAAALNGRVEQGLAQDIQDLVIRIFEACNFQDLASQRLAKVMATVNFIEDHVRRLLDEIETARPAAAAGANGQHLHGPRLANEIGHVSQSDIDAMFCAAR